MQKTALMLATTTFLVACGGGGGSSVTQPTPVQPTPPPSTETPSPTWEAGVFEPSENFKDRCEVVRTQPDINGNPYSDVQGSELEEKLWLRSWSDETYLWYDEILDQDPNNFSSPQSYFDVLVTEERTASGARKDNFHFLESTEEFESFSQSGTQTGYGIDWAAIRSSPPRNWRIATTDIDSSADLQGLLRGDRLIRINDEDFVDGNEVDFINSALFPSDENEEFDFTFERNDGSEITVTLTSGNYAKSFVNNISVFETATAKVGYLRFDGFQRPAQTPLIEGFQQFIDENVTELVLDLRYNGGGLLAMGSQLAYMIAGQSQTNNRTFETLQFNDKNPTTNPVTGGAINPTPFYSQEIDWEAGVFTGVPLPALDLTRVFIISTGDTCSASEAVINGLRGIDVEVVQIGGTTCGKPYGFYPTDNCGTTYYTIQFSGVNDKGFGEYAEGFKPSSAPQFDDELPGCSVVDDFENQLGDLNEGMLSTALERIATGACPASSKPSPNENLANKILADEQSKLSVLDTRYRSMMLENKIIQPILEASDE